MISAAKALVILTPDPYLLVRTFRIGEISEMEEAGAYDALLRTRDWAFGRTSPPSWLKYGLEVLGCEPKGNRKNTKVRDTAQTHASPLGSSDTPPG